MGVSTVGDVPAYSDLSRLAVVTSTPQSIADEDGRGAAYKPAGLAAGRLVHTHRVSDDVFLCFFDSTWTAATPSPGVLGDFTAKTVDPRPAAYWVSTGGTSMPAITGPGHTPAVLYPPRSVALVGGSSNGAMSYLLGRLNDHGVLLRYRAEPGLCSLISTEWVADAAPANGEAVVWDKGIFVTGNYLYLVGARPTTGALFLCKLPLTKARSAVFYLGAKGWTPNPAELSPLVNSSGLALTSVGPVSLGRYQHEWYLSRTPTASTVVFDRARSPLAAWQPLTQTVDLGTTIGMTAYFQPSVAANPDHPTLVGTDSVAALPYTYTTETATALRTRWGVLPIPRQRL